MNIKSRLAKLEASKPEQEILVVIKFNDETTPEQQKQIDEAEAKESQVIIVEFV